MDLWKRPLTVAVAPGWCDEQISLFHVADGCAAATAAHLCHEYVHLEETRVMFPVCLNRLDEAADLMTIL